MKLHWNMPTGLKPHYRQELDRYHTEFATGNLRAAWQHLERAHILGQPYPREHSYVHWRMLLFGIHIKSGREVLGQIPVGNTGGANVPPLLPMEMPADLAALLREYR